MTSKENDDDELNDSKPGEPTHPDVGGGAGGGAFASLPQAGSSTDGGPEWLKGLTEPLIEGLHAKSDRTHRYCMHAKPR